MNKMEIIRTFVLTITREVRVIFLFVSLKIILVIFLSKITNLPIVIFFTLLYNKLVKTITEKKFS